MINEKPVFWASNTKLNEPEGILKEQGWRKGSRPAASDFNWLFHTMQKDIHGLKVELNELKEKLSADMVSIKESLSKDIGVLDGRLAELKDSSSQIKATANYAVSETVINKKEGQLVIQALRNLHSELYDFVRELKTYYPDITGPGWNFNDNFYLLEEDDGEPVWHPRGFLPPRED